MRLLSILLAFSTLAACYSTEDFSSEYNQAVCDKIYECYDADLLEYIPNRGEDIETCYEDRDEPTQADAETCAFASDQAKLCVEETGDMACQDYRAGTNWPESCDLVCGSDE
jgi:hypothetical protein